MPLSKEMVEMLMAEERGVPKINSSYLDKLPTISPDIFPDNLLVWDVRASGGEHGRKLHELLELAGLTKSQRAGVTNLLNSFLRVEGNDLTLGDVRALTEDELFKLRGHFAWGAKPSVESIEKIKKLFG